MCKQCSRHNDTVGGLFGANGEFEINFELVAGVVVGAVAAKQADKLLDKVTMLKENPMYKDGAKIVVGFLLTQTDMDIATGAGYGMIGVAASNLVSGFLEKPAGGGLPFREQPGTQLTYINGIAYLNGIPYKQQPGSELDYVGKEKVDEEVIIEMY